MKKAIGTLCILLGLALLGCSFYLLTQNQREEMEAEQATVNLLPQLFAEIEQNIQLEQQAQEEAQASGAEIPPETVYVAPPEGVSIDFADPSIFEMKQTQIGGYGYIGYLSIPALKLDLPIMGEWDYHRLRIAPCRYVGSVQGNDLVIMAHNYNSHFGRLSKLSEGDRVTFTDMDGILTTYEVIALDILNPYAVEEVTSGDFDLTLFTCTYGGKSRVTVFCDIVHD